MTLLLIRYLNCTCENTSITSVRREIKGRLREDGMLTGGSSSSSDALADSISISGENTTVPLTESSDRIRGSVRTSGEINRLFCVRVYNTGRLVEVDFAHRLCLHLKKGRG